MDELSKEAGPLLERVDRLITKRPYDVGAGITGALGLEELYRHGPWGAAGRSKPEAKALQSVSKLEKQDQTDPQVQGQLRSSLSDQAKAVRRAELVGAPLGIAGAQAGGLLASRKLFRNQIRKVEKGQVTSPEQLQALHSDLTKQLGYAVPTTGLPEGGYADALTIPKGGVYPRFMRGMEEAKYAPVFEANMLKEVGPQIDEIRRVNPALADVLLGKVKEHAAQYAHDAIDKGHILAPSKAGPHFAAHEFGHALFGGSGVGKLTRAVRLPGFMLGNIAGATTATIADPDSTASKLSPLMSAAGMAPMLGEEAMASINAIKSMRRTGVFSPAQMSLAKKQLGRAFGTYGLSLGLPAIAAPYLIRKFKQYNQARREEQGLPSVGQLQQRITSLPQATGD